MKCPECPVGRTGGWPDGATAGSGHWQKAKSGSGRPVRVSYAYALFEDKFKLLCLLRYLTPDFDEGSKLSSEQGSRLTVICFVCPTGGSTMASSRLEKIGTIYSRVTGLLRAGAMNKFQKLAAANDTVNLVVKNSQTKCQKFMAVYQDLEAMHPNSSPDELFQEALDKLQSQFLPSDGNNIVPKSQPKISLASSFKDAQILSSEQGQLSKKIDIADVMKED
ncbi:hypothetical protein B566_EDAN012124 [Ephemera danica]|nr:hypothetical protein B566_EDAN012124 [Ephemera danica]